MKIKLLLILIALPLLSTFAQKTQQAFEPVDLVNPLMGTDSKPSLSNGNTYPAIGVPWGMPVGAGKRHPRASTWRLADGTVRTPRRFAAGRAAKRAADRLAPCPPS